jgi:hypothetical protein
MWIDSAVDVALETSQRRLDDVGLVLILASSAVLRRSQFARWIGIIAGALLAISAFWWMPYYPVVAHLCHHRCGRRVRPRCPRRPHSRRRLTQTPQIDDDRLGGLTPCR